MSVKILNFCQFYFIAVNPDPGEPNHCGSEDADVTGVLCGIRYAISTSCCIVGDRDYLNSDPDADLFAGA